MSPAKKKKENKHNEDELIEDYADEEDLLDEDDESLEELAEEEMEGDGEESY